MSARPENRPADPLLDRLCELAGLATAWCDIFGKTHDVAREDLLRILAALELGGEEPEALHARIEQLEREALSAPPLITAELSSVVTLPLPPGPWRLTLEAGGSLEGHAEADGSGSRITAPDQTGYHRLEMAGQQITLAVAPARCFTVGDALGSTEASAWGLAVQLYALRRDGDGGVGDYAALAGFAREAAAAGASALAISPVHAQFSADPDRFSPYAPSSRVMLNALHIAADAPGAEAARLEALELVDWPAVARDRLQRLRVVFDAEGADDPAFLAWRASGRDGAGDELEGHALFEALHAELWERDRGLWHWRSWPEQYASRDAPGSREFAGSHAREIAFHAWLQYRADRELAAAQQAAHDAGMAIGLISDLAVGTDTGGSHCWSRPGESLLGLTIGAPPDLLQVRGQNWGISAFSARGLRQNGFGAFIEMLRGAMRHAGGVRIDHGMGIARLWIIPDGDSADHGTYLAFPEDDLRRLIKLESVRNRAIVLAEDLGTVPEGFQERLQQAGIDGMRVLQFERDQDGFVAPGRWTRQASAMTSTHDLAPVAGWWAGHDIVERARILGMAQEQQDKEQAERGHDRAALWQAMCASGAAGGEQPTPQDTAPVVDAALGHTARARCELVMLPIEDVLGLIEQPNLPGTTDQHPNWRRRLHARSGSVLGDGSTASRLAMVDRLRAERSDSSA